MAQIQREFIRQCKFYNEAYLKDKRDEDGLSAIDYCDVIKGVTAFEKHTPCQFFLAPPRMGLDMEKLEKILDKEDPDREKYTEVLPELPKHEFVPEHPSFDENDHYGSPEICSADEAERSEALKMLGVRSEHSAVIIPGRGKVASTSGLNRNRAMGRGQLIKSLLERE